MQQNDFIQKLLSLDKPWKNMPDVAGRANRYLSKQTDARLVKYIRRGNRRAFDVLIRRYETKIKQILRAKLFNKSMVEDTAQELWLQVIPQLHGKEYREKGHFYKWMRTIAFRHAMMINRQKKYAPHIIEYLVDLHDVEDSIEKNDSVIIVSDEAKKIISGFKMQEQEIIRMRLEDEMAFKEIAVKLDVPVNHVRAKHSRCMKRVTNVLIQRGYKRQRPVFHQTRLRKEEK